MQDCGQSVEYQVCGMRIGWLASTDSMHQMAVVTSGQGIQSDMHGTPLWTSAQV